MIQSWNFSTLCITAAALFSLPVFGQSTVTSRLNKVPQSDISGSPIKRTVTTEAAAAAAATAVQVTGKFNVTFKISLHTAVPSGNVVSCTLTAAVTDIETSPATLNNEIEEVASTPATVSGTAASCVVPLPYSWYLANASNDTVDLTYTLQIVNSTTGVLTRYSSQFVPGAGSMKVPANGVTTSFTVNATI